ncbi:MAG: tetratricopeptide repeat protein [Planctomycetota bacterium]|nr:MAG: tetratricopeptide repeat protein [Planctomycetota bacterium]
MGKEIEKLRKRIRERLAEPEVGAYEFVRDVFEQPPGTEAKKELLEAATQQLQKTKDHEKRALLHLLMARINNKLLNNEHAREIASGIAEDENLPVAIRAYALNCIGDSYYGELDMTTAERYYKHALGLLDDETGEFSIYLFHMLGRAFLDHTRYYLALEYFQAHYDAVVEQKLEGFRARAVNSLAITFSFLGRSAEAEKCLFEALELARARGEREQEGVALANITNHFSQMENYEAALKYGRQALDIISAAGSPMQECATTINLASVYNSLDREDEALELAKNCVARAEELDLKEIIPSAYIMLGDLLHMRGDPESLFMLSKSVKLFETQFAGMEPQNVEYAFLKYGKMLLERDDARGGKYIWKSLEIFRKRPSSESTRKHIIEAENILWNLKGDFAYSASEQIEISSANLKRLLDITKAINLESRLPDALGKVLEFALEISGAERGIIWNFENGSLKEAGSKNFAKELAKEPGYGTIVEISHRAASRRAEILASNPKEIEALLLELVSAGQMPAKSVLALPLSGNGEATGVIYMDSRFAYLSIPPALKQLIDLLLEQAVIILDKLRQFEEESRQRRRLQKKVKLQEGELRKTLDLVEQQKEELEKRYRFENIIGRNAKMRKVLERAELAARTDLPVLIYGESGTGKELVARALHYGGTRSGKPFVPINCAAIPENLLEAELFGYEKGAFTGAYDSKEGLFEIAEGGTLLLDEVADMSAGMQAKLLRVVQENETRRIGGIKNIRINVRIIAASNRNLLELANTGVFREDLYYRLNVVTLNLPPLRERIDDIALFVSHLWKKAGGDPEKTTPAMKGEFLRKLESYDWPGNVRELENEIEKVAALGDGTMNPALLSEHIARGQAVVFPDINPGDDSRAAVRAMEVKMVVSALEKTNGNKAKAARMLGLPKSTFYYMVKKYGLQVK